MKTSRAPLRRIRLLSLCFSRSWGGLELMHLKIISALRARGHQAAIIAPGHSPLARAARKERIPLYPLSPIVRYLDAWTAIRLRAIFKATGAEVCIMGLSRDISTAVLAKKLQPRMKLIYFQQMQFGHDKRDFFHRWSYGHLDHWLTLTHAMRLSALQNTTVPNQKIHVIPFGADMGVFDPAMYRRSRSRRVFQIPRKKKVVALIGRFDRQKGQEEFLRAATTVVQHVPDAHFLLVGEETRHEGGFLGHLQALAEELSIRPRVQFLPFTPNVAELMAGVDLLVMPSYSETFGYLAVEAMAMGLPVVGSNAGGLPEIIEDGKTGFLVPPRDSRKLAERIVQVLKSQRLSKTFAAASKKRARRYFDFQRNIDQLEALLIAD